MPAAIPIAAAAISAYGAIKSSQNNKDASQTATTQNKIDPRAEEILYGSNGQGGLLEQYRGYLNTPQSSGLQAAGNAANNYLGSQSNNVIDQITSGANSLMQERNSAYSPDAQRYDASMAQAATAKGNMPSQNNLDLGSAYNQYIYGNNAENPYLTGGIQSGINQGMEAFNKTQSDMTRNLTENILPNLRGGAIASGQYGGSRQGISESKALNDFSTQLGRASENVGRSSIDSAIAAQAGAFDAGQNRGLSALGSLGGNQYSASSQGLSNQQQANMQNAQNRQQNNQYYSGLNQNNNQFNANSADRQAQLNSQNMMSGIGALQSLYSNQYGMAQNAQNADVNRAQQVNGLLAPYLGMGGSTTNSQPLYQNTTANALGSGIAGYQMGNQIMNMYNNSNTPAQSNYQHNPQTTMPTWNPVMVQNPAANMPTFNFAGK
jgi:hypothetical protein